jgi:putative flippase GtrA
VVNSLVGYVVIYLSMWLGLGPVWANVAGYGVGLMVAYQLNLRYVFRAAGTDRHRVARFLATFAIAYLLNLAVLRLALVGGIHPYIAQVVAAAPYLACMFLLGRCWVFRDRAS